MKTALLTAWVTTVAIYSYGQQRDTVIVPLANTSTIIFTIEDREDIQILKHYDFQALFQDVLLRLEGKDTFRVNGNDPDPTASIPAEASEEEEKGWRSDDEEDDDEDKDWDVHVGSRRWGKTWQSFNFDLGTNNYLANGKFPDSDDALYSVRPWGSWYVAVNSIQRTRIGKKFFVEWGMGLSWYNFKFQDDNVAIEKNDNGVVFVEDTRDVSFRKSKLSMSFVQASLIPVIDFGDHSRKPRVWDGYRNSLRIGIGPYAGYRISSHSKLVYNDSGREKDKDRDNFYLNNFRYGLRFQVGYRSTDLFFNYDLNELFSSGRGPELNAFSFGVIF